jgi:hypothetical protein
MSAVSPLPKVRNPRTAALIRREVLWQIAVPLGVALALTLTLMVLVVLGTAAPASTGALADVSLMLLILIAFAFGLGVLVVLAALVYGVAYLLRESPFWFKRLQDFLWGIAGQTKAMTRQVDNRIVGVHLTAAALESMWAQVRALFAPWRTP